MSVIEVNETNFESEVLRNKKVLVDFNADWCGPCQMLRPVVEEVANENDNVKIVSINVDNNDVLSEKFNVFSIPCLVLFENGKEVKRNVGVMTKDEIIEMIGE